MAAVGKEVEGNFAEHVSSIPGACRETMLASASVKTSTTRVLMRARL
jgi:hypothetical protein